MGFNGLIANVRSPRVCERFDLCRRLFATLFSKQHVVVRVGVERRIELNQIDGFVLDVTAEYVEVVAVV